MKIKTHQLALNLIVARMMIRIGFSHLKDKESLLRIER